MNLKLNLKYYPESDEESLEEGIVYDRTAEYEEEEDQEPRGHTRPSNLLKFWIAFQASPIQLIWTIVVKRYHVFIENILPPLSCYSHEEIMLVKNMSHSKIIIKKVVLTFLKFLFFYFKR